MWQRTRSFVAKSMIRRNLSFSLDPGIFHSEVSIPTACHALNMGAVEAGGMEPELVPPGLMDSQAGHL